MVNKLHITPGDILKEEFLEPLAITPYKVAKDTGISATALGEIIAGKRSITSETGLILDKYFRMSEGFWSRIQNHYDLFEARKKMKKRLTALKPLKMAHLEAHPV